MYLIALVLVCVLTGTEAKPLNRNYGERLSELAMQAANDQEYATAVNLWIESAEVLSDDHLKAQCYFNVGLVFQKLGDFISADLALAEAIKWDEGMTEAMVKKAFGLVEMGKPALAVPLLQSAAVLLPHDPNPHLYLAHIYNNQKNYELALQASLHAETLAPSLSAPHLSSAISLYNLALFPSSLSHYFSALRLSSPSSQYPSPSTMAEARVGVWLTRSELSAWDLDLLAKISSTHASSDPHVDLVIQADSNDQESDPKSYEEMYGEWEELIDAVVKESKEQMQARKPISIHPYQALLVPREDTEWRMNIAKGWSRYLIGTARRSMQFQGPLWKAASIDLPDEEALSREGGRPLRVGYLSRRFHDYPGTQLMRRIFGNHDPLVVDLFCFAHGPDDFSPLRSAIKADCPHFHDISEFDPLSAASFIASLHIDVLVTYDGAHSLNSLDVLAMRPAPVQIAYLGFAGTTGAMIETEASSVPERIIDFVLTDEILTPPLAPWTQHFTERLLILPQSYQPQDDQQEIAADPSLTRSHPSVSLPAGAFVFCSLNRVNKMEPRLFSRWMQILRQAPNSVLWLYVPEEKARELLVESARRHLVDPARLFFASHHPKALHLARQRLADLFLDSFFYNGHTTCSDALWARLPVLTLLGNSFGSRVAGSILHSLGMDAELVVHTEEEYVQRAVELATSPEKMRLVKDKLDTAITDPDSRSVVFRPKLQARALEAAFLLAHRLQRRENLDSSNAALRVPNDLLTDRIPWNLGLSSPISSFLVDITPRHPVSSS